MKPARTHHVSQIVRETGRRLMRFIRARVATDADAEDVLQDVWQQLMSTLADGPIEQVGAWLYTVARNRIVDGYRKTRPTSLEALSRDGDEESDSGLAALLLSDGGAGADEPWRKLFWADFEKALAELPADQRQVFVWHEIDGLSFQDMAALTGEKVNTLLSRKRYAVLHLRRRLEPWLEEFVLQISK